MNIENLKKSLKYVTVPASIDIDGEKFKFNVHKTVPYERNEEFISIVIDEAFRNGQYHAEFVEPGIDFATVAIFTDIDVMRLNRDEMHALMYTTDLLQVIDRSADAIYLYNLRDAARNLVAYYLEISKPRSASEQSMEKLNNLFDALTDAMRFVKEKVTDFDLSGENVEKLVELSAKLAAMNTDADTVGE